MVGALSHTGTDSLSFGYSPRKSKLQGVDGAVKAHEKAHLLALGAYAKGGISYDYIITPDGQKYAVGGSVGVDLKPVPGNPEATIRKMQTIRAAAMSPLSPSAADSGVAAKAIQVAMQARRELEKHNKPESPEPVSIETAPLEPDAMPVSESKLYSAGSPEMIIRNAKGIRSDILRSDTMSAGNMQLLARTYVIEMQAKMKLEDSERNAKHIDIIA